MDSISAPRFHRSHSAALWWVLILSGVVLLVLSGDVGLHHHHPTKHNRTNASLAAIKMYLEAYRARHGNYPAEASWDGGALPGVSLRWADAAMLYQAITGDGTDFLVPPGRGAPSDGRLDESERARMIGDFPGFVVASAGLEPGTPGPRYLIDGFGNPVQYFRGGVPEAVNETFDLWSYADGVSTSVNVGKSAKKDPIRSDRWIKNW